MDKPRYNGISDTCRFAQDLSELEGFLLCKEAEAMYRIIYIIVTTTAFIWWIYKVDKSLKK